MEVAIGQIWVCSDDDPEFSDTVLTVEAICEDNPDFVVFKERPCHTIDKRILVLGNYTLVS